MEPSQHYWADVQDMADTFLSDIPLSRSRH
jgi:hypothetical protein